MNTKSTRFGISRCPSRDDLTSAAVRTVHRPQRGLGRPSICIVLSLCIACSTTLGLVPIRAHAVEPISTTAVAIWGITQGLAFLLRLGKSGADPHFEMSAQNRDMLRHLLEESAQHTGKFDKIFADDARLLESVRNGQILVAATHQRIDVLGETMIRATKKIDELPSVIKEDVQALLDKHREEDMGGLIDTIDNHLRDLQHGNVRKDNLQQLWTDYLMLRNTLVAHQTRGLTALIMPKLYLFEERMWRALEFTPSERETYRNAYIVRIDREVDGALTGTIMNQYSTVLEELHKNEDTIRRSQGNFDNSLRLNDTVVQAMAEIPDVLGVKYRRVAHLPNRGYSGERMRRWINWFLEDMYHPTIDAFIDRWRMRRRQLSNLTDTYARERNNRARYTTELRLLREKRTQFLALANMYAASISALAEFARYVGHDVPHSAVRDLYAKQATLGG